MGYSAGGAVDVSRLASDCVFSGDSLSAVADIIEVARNARRRMRENFALAALYNLLAVPVALAGWVPLMVGMSVTGLNLLFEDIGGEFHASRSTMSWSLAGYSILLAALLLPGGRCTADQVAQHLGVDRRTVHRRLLRENESFSSVLRWVRREFVQRQLADADRTMAEVAELLGFSGSSAFAHWFRTEFGCTVGAWRRARAAAVGTAAATQP